MGQRGPRQPLAAEHACDFGYPLFTGDNANTAGRRRARTLFADDQMVVGARSDLRQMGDGQHLPVVPQLLHEPANRFGNCPAHT